METQELGTPPPYPRGMTLRTHALLTIPLAAGILWGGVAYAHSHRVPMTCDSPVPGFAGWQTEPDGVHVPGEHCYPAND